MFRLPGILLCVFLLPPAVLSAQFKKGDRMAGASVASVLINSGSSDITVTSIGGTASTASSYNISIVPQMGWFLSEKTAVGATININPTGNKITYEQNGVTYQSDKTNGFNLGIGGFVRHYFNGSGILPFIQAGINAGITNLKTEGFFYGGSGSGAYKITYDGNSTGGFFFNAPLAIGITKMLSEWTGLDIYAGYTYSFNKNTFKKTTLKDLGNDGSVDERLENETTTRYTNHGFQLGVGFQVFLKKKK